MSIVVGEFVVALPQAPEDDIGNTSAARVKRES